MSRAKNDIMRFMTGGKVHRSRKHGKITVSDPTSISVAEPFTKNFEKHHIRKSKSSQTSEQKRQSARDKASHIDDERSVLKNTMLHLSQKEYDRAVRQINKGNTSFKARGRMTHTEYDPGTTPPTMYIEGPTKGSYELHGEDHRTKKQKKGTTGATLDHFARIDRIDPLNKLKHDDGNTSSDSD